MMSGLSGARSATCAAASPRASRDLETRVGSRFAFAARTRLVLLAPYERVIDTGEPLRYGALSSSTRLSWLKIASAVAEGL